VKAKLVVLVKVNGVPRVRTIVVEDTGVMAVNVYRIVPLTGMTIVQLLSVVRAQIFAMRLKKYAAYPPRALGV